MEEAHPLNWRLVRTARLLYGHATLEVGWGRRPVGYSVWKAASSVCNIILRQQAEIQFSLPLVVDD